MNKKEFGDNYIIFENGDIFNKYNKKLSPCDNGKGYLMVNVNINGKRTCKTVHRLLGEAFLPNPNNYSDINHIDGNRQNNALENLEWVTHGQNIKHSYNLNNRTALGTNNANCKHDEFTVIAICELLSQGFKAAAIRDLGYPYSLTRQIKQRKNWRYISDNYIF